MRKIIACLIVLALLCNSAPSLPSLSVVETVSAQESRLNVDLLANNFFILEGCKYRRLPTSFDVSGRPEWMRLYIPLSPRYYLEEDTSITIPKGDSVILSLSTMLLALALHECSDLLGLPYTLKEVEDFLNSVTISTEERVPIVDESGVRFEETHNTSTGPGFFLAIFHDKSSDLLSNYRSLMRQLIDLSRDERKLEEFLTPFTVRWEIDNPALGLLYPVKLDNHMPGDYIPYSNTTDIKFGKENLIIPACKGRGYYYSAIGIRDPVRALLENTVIVAANPSAFEGSFNLKITIEHPFLEYRKVFNIRFKIGDEYWKFMQGNQLSESSVSEINRKCKFSRLGWKVFQETNDQVIGLDYSYESGTNYYRFSNGFLSLQKPKVSVGIAGYGEFGEAMLEFRFDTSCVYSRCSSSLECLRWGKPCPCPPPRRTKVLLNLYDPKRRVYKAVPPARWGGDLCFQYKYDRKYSREKLDSSIKVAALLPAGGALPFPYPIASSSVVDGNHFAREEMGNSLDAGASQGYRCHIDPPLSELESPEPKWEEVTLKCEGYSTGGCTPLYFGERSRTIGGKVRISLASTPRKEGSNYVCTLGLSSLGRSHNWRKPWNGEPSSWVGPGEILGVPSLVLRYILSGTPGPTEEVLCKESFMDLGVSYFYTSPGDKVDAWVNAVRDGEPLADEEVEIRLLLSGEEYDSFTVRTDGEGKARFTIDVPTLDEIHNLFGFDVLELDDPTVVLDVTASVNSRRMADSESINIVVCSAIAGHLYGADLELLHETSEVQGVVTGTMTLLNARLVDRGDSSLSPYEYDASLILSALVGEPCSFTIRAVDKSDPSKVYETTTSIGFYILKVPFEGDYKVTLTVMIGDRKYSLQPIDVKVENGEMTILNFDIPVALIIRAEKLLDELEEWRVKNTDIYEMLLALFKGADIVGLLRPISKSIDEILNLYPGQMNVAIDEMVRASYQGKTGLKVPRVEDYLRKVKGDLSRVEKGPSHLAERLATVSGSLEYSEPLREILLLDQTNSLPKYDLQSVRSNPNDPYNKLIRALLFLAYLDNRRDHVVGQIKTFAKVMSLQLSIYLTSSLVPFQAPVAALKYAQPLKWMKLKIPQILLLGLFGLDLNIGYTKSLTFDFLNKCGERFPIDKSAFIVGYFKLVRFVFAGLVGEFRKDLNFEILFHLCNQVLSHVLLNIYLMKIQKNLNSFVDELRRGHSKGSLLDAISNAQIMDFDTNGMEMQGEALVKTLSLSFNIGRMTSGVMDIAKAAQTFMGKGYVARGEQLFKVMESHIGKMTFTSYQKVNEISSVTRLSPQLESLIKGPMWGNTIKALKRCSNALILTVIGLTLIDVTGWSPFMALSTAVAILDSTIRPDRIPPDEIITFMKTGSVNGGSYPYKEDARLVMAKFSTGANLIPTKCNQGAGLAFQKAYLSSGNGWSEAVELKRLLAKICRDAEGGIVEAQDMKDALDLFKRIRDKLAELNLELVSEGKTNPDVVYYRSAIVDEMNDYLSALSTYIQSSGLSLEEFLGETKSMTEFLDGVVGLPAPSGRGIKKGMYEIAFDVYPQVTNDGDVTIEVTPFGDVPNSGKILITSSPNVTASYTSKSIDPGSKKVYGLQLDLSDDSLFGWAVVSLLLGDGYRDDIMVIVTKPIVNLMESTTRVGKIHVLVSADVKIRGNGVVLENAGTNYIVIRSEKELTFTPPANGGFGVTAIREQDGSIDYFVTTIAASGISAAAGTFTPMPLKAQTIAAIAAGVAVAAGLAASLLLRRRLKVRP